MMVIHPRTSKYVSAAFTIMLSFLASLICKCSYTGSMVLTGCTVSDFVMVLSMLAKPAGQVCVVKGDRYCRASLVKYYKSRWVTRKVQHAISHVNSFPRLGAFVANSHQRSAVRQLAYAANRTSDLPMPFYNTYKSLRQGQSSAA